MKFIMLEGGMDWRMWASKIIYVGIKRYREHDGSPRREEVHGKIRHGERFFVERVFVERGFGEKVSPWTNFSVERSPQQREASRQGSLYGENSRG